MGLDAIELVGGLGNRLAQQHYNETSDLDGVLPWLPTDADRAVLVQELGRTATLEEERAFEAGYRESIGRLDGNAHSPLLNKPMWHELRSVLMKYGFLLPPEQTPEHQRAYVLTLRMLDKFKKDLGALYETPANVGAKTSDGDQEVGT